MPHCLALWKIFDLMRNYDDLVSHRGDCEDIMVFPESSSAASPLLHTDDVMVWESLD